MRREFRFVLNSIVMPVVFTAVLPILQFNLENWEKIKVPGGGEVAYYFMTGGVSCIFAIGICWLFQSKTNAWRIEFAGLVCIIVTLLGALVGYMTGYVYPLIAVLQNVQFPITAAIVYLYLCLSKTLSKGRNDRM